MIITKIQKTSLVLLILLFGSIQGTQAQFWKKIKERAKQAAEETILRKTEQKAMEKTEQVIDSIFELPKRKKRRPNRQSGTDTDSLEIAFDESVLDDYLEQNEDIDLPDSYTFEWKYSLRMEANKNDVTMHYMINPSANYFGMALVVDDVETTKNSVTIMDRGRNAYIMLTYLGGQKMIRTTTMPSEILDTEDPQTESFDLVKTDTKEILGYTCQGYKTEMNNGVMHMYIAENAPVSFNRAFGTTQNAPKGLNQKLLKELENGIMLEAEFIGAHKKDNFKTTCIELKKMQFTLHLDTYQTLEQIRKQ